MAKQDTAWVIDDDQSIRWVLEKALQKAGIAVRSFDSAANVPAALKQAQPEIMRGVTKGVIHRNTASRRISRLSARIKAIPAKA